jgi:hypothetical protein
VPAFTYTGLTERVYPETRDSWSVPLGLVKPGDVLELDQAPDQFWTPYEDDGTGEGAGQDGTEGEGGEPPADPETPETAPQDVPPGD